jgi:hypothetical protein
MELAQNRSPVFGGIAGNLNSQVVHEISTETAGFPQLSHTYPQKKKKTGFISIPVFWRWFLAQTHIWGNSNCQAISES